MNSVALIGRLGTDPRIEQTTGGTAVANFSIAVDKFRKGGQKITNWINVKVFGKQAEACGAYLFKGSKVGVNGEISVESWEKDGKKNYAVRIIANNVQFLTTKKEDKADCEPF